MGLYESACTKKKGAPQRTPNPNRETNPFPGVATPPTRETQGGSMGKGGANVIDLDQPW